MPALSLASPYKEDVLRRTGTFNRCHGCDNATSEFGDNKCACGKEFEPSSYYVHAKQLLLTPGVYILDVFRKFTPEAWPTGVTPMGEVYYWEGLTECPHASTWIAERVSHLFMRANVFPVIEKSLGIYMARSNQDDGAASVVEPISSDTPEEKLNRLEKLEILCKAITGLPPVERLVIVKIYFEGHSVRSVAELMDITSHQAGLLLRNGKRRLRDMLNGQISYES